MNCRGDMNYGGDMRATAPAVDISVEAALFVREHGGRLFIWTQRQVCCKGRTSFRTQVAFEDPGHKSFDRVFSSEQLELYLAAGVSPKEVTVALSTFPRRRIVAFWPGCMHQ